MTAEEEEGLKGRQTQGCYDRKEKNPFGKKNPLKNNGRTENWVYN